MLRKIAFLLVFTLISTSGFALNKADLNSCLKDLANGISRTAYSMSEKANSAERKALEAATESTEKSEKELRKIISNIETPDDFAKAESVINAFGKKGKVNAHTAALANKLLKERAKFVTTSGGKKITVKRSAHRATRGAPEKLLSRRQKRLITVDTPVAEAILSFEDTKEDRRVKNLESILQRHECKIISKHEDKSGDDPQHNYYFSGKKYVVDAILGHFGGSIVKADLEARLKITAGGFWSGKKSKEFLVTPKRTRSSSVMGELSWYKSVIEADPIKYLASKHYQEISTLGKTESVAGEKKLHLKNVIVEIWVSSKSGLKKNAVYYNELEIGDIYTEAQ
jgi:hypothetical protein